MLKPPRGAAGQRGSAGATPATLASALAALYARVPLGMRLGLDAMREACARADHPERAFEIVHVAGTNGKGSTCAMVESMARARGGVRRTGLYTSPHLVRFAERIRVDGVPLDDDALTGVLDEALRMGPDLSFFETATLAAFLAFRRANVELAVVEVGIGGRLDATNVIPPPRCAAVTRVALDHQDKLGDTLSAIAREKAAIAKPGVPIVIGAMPEEARVSVVTVAREKGARVVEAEELPRDVTLGLAGPHQVQNARIAWTIGAELGLDVDARRRGLADARWPGRLERIDVSEGSLAGPWILDGAHNPDGMDALVAALARGTSGGDAAPVEPGAIVFGALADKAWRPMLAALGSVDAARFYVAPPGRAPADVRELAACAPGSPASSLVEALARARAKAGARLVVVCGSLYLVGEARARLLGLASDLTVAL